MAAKPEYVEVTVRVLKSHIEEWATMSIHEALEDPYNPPDDRFRSAVVDSLSDCVGAVLSDPKIMVPLLRSAVLADDEIAAALRPAIVKILEKQNKKLLSPEVLSAPLEAILANDLPKILHDIVKEKLRSSSTIDTMVLQATKKILGAP